MATFSKIVLSESVNGRGVTVAATASSGTAIHTGFNNANTIDEIWLYATVNNPVPPSTVSNKALTSNVATITTSAAHNLSAADSVTISGVDATFDGTFVVATVPTSTTFTYAKTATNVVSISASGSVQKNVNKNVTLTLQWGGTTAVDDDITFTVTNQDGLYLIAAGLLIQGNATPLVVRAFADVASKVVLHGYVNRITA